MSAATTSSTPTTGVARFFDGLERSVWTVAEAAGATGIVAGYQALDLPDIPRGYVPLAIILVAGVLAGIKSAVAQRWGNGTAATLPAEYEPVPVDVVSGEIDVAVDNALRDVDPDPDADGDGRGDVTGRFKARTEPSDQQYRDA